MNIARFDTLPETANKYDAELQKNFKIRLPEAVTGIIHTLQAAGFEAYAVGGCVRDSILGRVPDDWDITTSAKPEQVKALFHRTVDTGIQHGTVTVLADRCGYEVTTYRIDGEYEDGRHPKDVVFTASLEEDLKRRDFTINAMAYNEEDGLVDMFDGIGDIQRKVLRCVGDPKARFCEDALRMMRAVRFSAQLDYEIEEKTKAAIGELAQTLSRISAERIQVELTKLLVSAHPERIRVCYETGLTAVFFPEFDRMMETEQNNPHHCYNVGEHTIRALTGVRADKSMRLAMLLHDSGKILTKTTDENGVDHFHGHAEESGRIARTMLRRLKFDNDTTDRVVRLVRAHDVKIERGAKYMRRALSRLGEDLFPDLFEVKEADMRAQSMYQRAEKEADLAERRRIYEEVKDAGDCVSLKSLAVNGSDLIAAGMKPGKELGEILKALLEEVLEDPSCNEKEILLKKAKESKIGH
ncbi:MAG: CCA tRNA nucleotidyltransferase [Eubacteriales bacterium]|nr:CCA tRNA nucleotidyltransferase [Eubacteriales bacterium]